MILNIFTQNLPQKTSENVYYLLKNLLVDYEIDTIYIKFNIIIIIIIILISQADIR